jgi:hypothetical protein
MFSLKNIDDMTGEEIYLTIGEDFLPQYSNEEIKYKISSKYNNLGLLSRIDSKIMSSNTFKQYYLLKKSLLREQLEEFDICTNLSQLLGALVLTALNDDYVEDDCWILLSTISSLQFLKKLIRSCIMTQEIVNIIVSYSKYSFSLQQNLESLGFNYEIIQDALFLPDEFMIHFLAYLNRNDLRAFYLVNKQSHKIISNDRKLRLNLNSYTNDHNNTNNSNLQSNRVSYLNSYTNDHKNTNNTNLQSYRVPYLKSEYIQRCIDKFKICFAEGKSIVSCLSLLYTETLPEICLFIIETSKTPVKHFIEVIRIYHFRYPNLWDPADPDFHKFILETIISKTDSIEKQTMAYNILLQFR